MLWLWRWQRLFFRQVKALQEALAVQKALQSAQFFTLSPPPRFPIVVGPWTAPLLSVNPAEQNLGAALGLGL